MWEHTKHQPHTNQRNTTILLTANKHTWMMKCKLVYLICMNPFLFSNLTSKQVFFFSENSLCLWFWKPVWECFSTMDRAHWGRYFHQIKSYFWNSIIISINDYFIALFYSHFSFHDEHHVLLIVHGFPHNKCARCEGARVSNAAMRGVTHPHPPVTPR